jgi:hypothetical protein
LEKKLMATKDNVRTVLTDVVNALPYGSTETRQKELATANKVADGIDASDDTTTEVPAKIRFFVTQTVACANRTAEEANKFADVKLEMQNRAAAAVNDFQALQAAG